MKKIIGLALAFLLSTQAMASDINLPKPEREGKTSLMEALNARHSSHAFSEKEVGMKELSTILWAAYGLNREDGKRTIPTAKNQKDLEIYVFRKDGIYQYEAEGHTLKQISGENQLDLFKKQDYMAPVSTVLVYVGSPEDYSAMHAGSAYQNVGLYAASVGMANIVRGMFDRDGVKKALHLKDGQRLIISQAIGWPDTK